MMDDPSIIVLAAVFLVCMAGAVVALIISPNPKRRDNR